MSSAAALRQPTRRFPLLPTGLARTPDLGVVGLRCRAVLRLGAEGGRPPVPVSFVVDSGASYSMISLELAQLRHLSMDLLGHACALAANGPRNPALFALEPRAIRFAAPSRRQPMWKLLRSEKSEGSERTYRELLASATAIRSTAGSAESTRSTRSSETGWETAGRSTEKLLQVGEFA